MKIIFLNFVLINFYVLADERFEQYAFSNPEEGNFHEGDIILRRKQIQQADLHGEAVTLSDSIPWPKNIIHYEIERGFKKSQLKQIKAAMKRIEKVSCIKFRKKKFNNIKFLRIQHAGGTTCAAQVGFPPYHQESFMYLSDRCQTGTIMHELMHVLGFWHEQSRWDRDNYVQILFKNIKEKHRNNFGKQVEKQAYTLQLPYDYLSIMHYSYKGFQNKRDRVTIFPFEIKYIRQLGQRKRLSDIDIKKLNIFYNCP